MNKQKYKEDIITSLFRQVELLQLFRYPRVRVTEAPPILITTLQEAELAGLRGELGEVRQQLLVAVTEREGLEEQQQALQELLLQKEVGGAGEEREGVRVGWGWSEKGGARGGTSWVGLVPL